MKSRIIDKINETLAKDNYNEKDVYYVIGQSRKYLESCYPLRDDRENKYPTLSLFEDWILHSKLCGKGAQKKLKEYSDFFAKYSNNTSKFMTEGFILFKELKSDLLIFCKDSNINTNFLIEKQKWQIFLQSLVEILKDLPLEGEGVINSFKFEDQIIITDRTAVSFTITYQNGVTGHFAIDLDLLS